MEIIFNGDDLGATANVTRGIFECWQQGFIDGFSILANGEVVDEVGRVLEACHNQTARIAVHLNISEGPSIADARQVPLLVNASGHLCCDFVPLLKTWLLANVPRRKELLQQIEIEWRAQIRKVQTVCGGRTIQALDSHRYTHMLPFLFPLAAHLAKEFGIAEIRMTREPFYLSSDWKENMRPHFFVNLIKHGILRICSWFSRAVVQPYALKTSDAILGVLYTGAMTPAAIASGIHKAKRCGVQRLEVIVHVGYAELRMSGMGHFDLNDQVRNRERLDLIRFHKDLHERFDGRSRPQE